jgi:transposase
MAAHIRSKKSGKRRSRVFGGVHKARGTVHPRVQQVGPERFGVVSVDCAKARSVWMLCNFYGRVLLPPAELPHSQGHFQAALVQLRQAIDEHGLKDLIVAVERTGNYHLPVKRAFAAAGLETRIVHPFATKQFRQAANPGSKTDENDLAAIHRAAVNGFGLTEPACDPLFEELRLLARHRRDLVQKRSAVYCQVREHWEAILPGYAACFDDVWETPVALAIPRHFASAAALVQAGLAGLRRHLQEQGLRFQTPTLERVLTWARLAAAPDPRASIHHRVWLELDADLTAKTHQIRGLECDLAALLVRTPYVLLLSHPGINVVSAAEFAGEAGPIGNYAHHRAITGRAGLFPARYQSDAVDLADGSLVRCANRALRAAILLIAANLAKCNSHYRSLVEVWTAQGKNPRHSKVKIASRFCRGAYQIVAGRQVFHHPACRQRDYILEKLLAFHREHQTPPGKLLGDLQASIEQLPRSAYAEEAAPLTVQLQQVRAARRRGAQPLGELLPFVLASLGVGDIQSTARFSGSRLVGSSGGHNAFIPHWGKPLEKLGALSDHQRLIRQFGIPDPACTSMARR